MKKLAMAVLAVLIFLPGVAKADTLVQFNFTDQVYLGENITIDAGRPLAFISGSFIFDETTGTFSNIVLNDVVVPGLDFSTVSLTETSTGFTWVLSDNQVGTSFAPPGNNDTFSFTDNSLSILSSIIGFTVPQETPVYINDASFRGTLVSAPEPATWTLLLAGIALLVLIRFRTSRAA